MSQLSRHPGFEFVEDQLDAVGQRFRILQISRGAIRWVGWGLIFSVAAALAADWAGAGVTAKILFIAWAVWLVATAIAWFLRPILLRPSPALVARMVERRFAELHDGLTNSLLLSQADDLSQSPFLGPIFDEVAASCRTQPLEDAVDFAALRTLALRLAGPLAAAIIIVVLFPAHFAHGWQQMFAPSTFIPRAGAVSIIDVTPGNVTRVTGEPLEIQVIASGPQTTPPPAKIFVDDAAGVEMSASVRPSDGDFIYGYRIDHVDKPLRYRVEISGSQSDWFSVELAEKVTLTSMDVTITPPAYTRQPVRKLTLSPKEAEHAQWIVPQGSRLEIGAGIDVPAKNAVLLVNSDAPVAMSAALEGHRFYHDTVIAADAVAYVGILGGDQIIAKLPENGVSIRSLPDAPPTVVMQWPTQDLSLAPTPQITLRAQLGDDYGISSARLLVGFGDAQPAALPETGQAFADAPQSKVVEFPLKLTDEQTKQDSTITLQVEATDNRDLSAISRSMGPQSSRGPKIVIRFSDPRQIAQQQAEQSEKLATRLGEMIKLQQSLSDKTRQTLAVAGGPTTRPVDADAMKEVAVGQTQLRDMMKQTADQFEFSDKTRIVQKTLQVIAVNAATDAVDLSSQVAAEPLVSAQLEGGLKLTVKQASILESLRALLARLNAADQPTTQPDSVATPSIPERADAFKKLDDALKAYEKEQQRVLNQTAPLAKKPVADYDAADKKNLDDLRMAQDKLDAFMQENLADFSKDAEQDLSNPALLKELMSVYSDVTMAADALNKQSAEVAVPLEEQGLEGAEELKTNIEKWLANKPDRDEWTMEDPVSKNDPPLADLPKELEDMEGDLLEQQEDLDEKMQDANSNWQDSMDTAIGWDAQDGPIADMSAKGITGNTLPNDNEMQGRSGEGRTGQSSGEFVGDSAVGKGGRDTPTRLDPTPFQAGQIKDTSKDPVGGATGGGKVSGAGSAGLEGPVPQKEQEEMQRLAKMQAQIRNTAEKLNLQYKLGNYDNFKLLQSIVNMRRVE
ncbi:MAG: hypothetical protein ABSH22_17875, partial [Tepidisphaeraceae bacterium]